MEEIEKSESNKLIIIGNGFDLSLRIKTSYKDFLLWLLQKYIKKTYEKKHATHPKYKIINQLSKEEERLKVNLLSENGAKTVLVQMGNHNEMTTLPQSILGKTDVPFYGNSQMLLQKSVLGE